MIETERPEIQMTLGSSSHFHCEWVLGRLKAEQVKNSILDFGAGRGELLRRLHGSQLVDLYGADLFSCPADLQSLVQWKTADLEKDSFADWNGRFNAICAIEVIEHLENPRNAFRLFSRLLAPNGLLIVTIPNVVSLRSTLSLVVRGNFVDFLDNSYPAHITPIVPMDLQRMAIEQKFNQLSLSYSGRGVVPTHTSTTWQKMSGGFLRGAYFSDHVMLMARKV